MTIDEIKDELINTYQTDENTIKGLKKSELEQLLLEQKALATAEVVEDKEQDNADKDRPNIGDVKWTEYVLSLMDKNELEEGMPKVDALRRVAYKLFGVFSELRTDVIQAPTMENNDRATVSVTIVTLDGRIVSGAADVYVGNTEKKFAIHPVATAETRAEGRALRKLLGLSKILSAEELDNADPYEANGTDNQISASMISGLKIMSDRIGVDLLGVAKAMNYEIVTLEDLTKTQGVQISNKLSKYHTGQEEVPKELKL